MYVVYIDDICAHQPGDATAAMIEPRLEMAVGKAGSFSGRIAPTNPAYEHLLAMKSLVRVEQDGKPIFYGRIISIDKDFNKTMTITAEGELAYLLDTIQPPAEFHNITVRGFLDHLITTHNTQVGEAKHFRVGQVTVSDPNDSLYRYTNYETTLEAITDKLVKRLGGYLRLRYEHGARFIDYIEGFETLSNQDITFGTNLLDYSEGLNAADIATRIIPLGARLESSPIAALDAYTTIETINEGRAYVEDPDAIETFGIITRVVTFDNVTEPANLKRKAEHYLSDVQFADLTITLSAIDLHLLDTTIDAYRLGQGIRVYSPPHGMDRMFTLENLHISLDDPASSTITLGNTSKTTITGRSVSQNNELLARIESLPTQSNILGLARDNATALINAQTTGHVTTRPNEILIMDHKDKNSAQRLWRWNINGLGYSRTGINGPYGLAMTMDGAIVADFITTGVLNADLIKAGTLTDANGTITWNLATGSLSAKRLSIDSPNFTLTPSGEMSASGAAINGTITNETGDTKIRMRSGHLEIFYDGKELGLIGANGFVDDDNIAGLNFDLENTGDYMTWAAQPPGGGLYEMVWTYARSNFGSFSAGMLNAGCDIDMHNHTLKNVTFEEGGITGRIDFVTINSVNSNGSAGSWTKNCHMEFKNGILISATF